MSPVDEQMQRFCEELDSIDDVVDEINADGPVELTPQNMTYVLGRLGAKFKSVAESAPDEELRQSLETAAAMFLDGSAAISGGPPDEAVPRAAEIFQEAMAGVEDAGAKVSAFRRKHCE